MEPSLQQSLSKEIADVVASLRKDITSSVIATTSGLNYYNLEPIAKNLYPVFYPLLQSIPRVPPMQNGVKVGGTAVNYKGIVAVDPGGYPGISEGNRNAYLALTERDFTATYKWLGKDAAVTFQAESTAVGLDDAVGIGQLSALNALLNDQERMILWGNSGTGGNGFALTAATPQPTLALASGGSIANAKFATVYCVALTGWGLQLATATGVRPVITRTLANGGSENFNGGVGVLSAASAEAGPTVSATNHQAFTATITNPPAGALGFAWYISLATTGAEAAATAYFCGVTSIPTITITAAPADTNQAADDATLGTDHASNSLDYDGIITWIIGTQDSSQPAYYKNLVGASLTPNGDTTIKEVEDALKFLWDNYKIAPDYFLYSGDLADSIWTAVVAPGSGGAQRISLQMDQLKGLIAGGLVTEYRSKRSNTGQAKPLPMRLHPWLPNGTILLYTINNPYPAAGASIPSVLRMVCLEDHFGIKYPYQSLKHSMGVYVFETLQNYVPFGHALICGAKPS